MNLAAICMPNHVATALLAPIALAPPPPPLPRRDFLTHTLVSLSTASATVPLGGVNDETVSSTDAVVLPPERRRNGTTLPLRSIETAAQRAIDGLGPMAVYPDPILRRTASPVTDFGPAVERVANLLASGMVTNSTTALQYGIDARMIVLRGTASPLAGGAPLVLINPNILARSGEDKMVPWREYCGDLPDDLRIEVELLRDEVVEVAAQDVRGVPIRKSLRGEAARAFQHELDHLDGLLIIDHAGLDELPRVVAEWEALNHQVRQQRAYQRKVYQGNEPLYW